MRVSLRIYFLIGAAGAVFHASWGQIVFVLAGYFALQSFEEWLVKRARDRALEDEICGWTPDPDDPEMENKGALTRKRLSGSDQVIVTRLSEFIWRIR